MNVIGSKIELEMHHKFGVIRLKIDVELRDN